MKRNMTSNSRNYIMMIKSNIKKIMINKGLPISKVSRMSGMPRSSISRWLSMNNDDFMGVAEMVILSEVLGVTINDIISNVNYNNSDYEHMAIMNLASRIPKNHLSAMIKFYADISK